MYTLLKETSYLEIPSPEKQQKVSDKYDQIVTVGLDYHNGLKPLKFVKDGLATTFLFVCATSK